MPPAEAILVSATAHDEPGTFNDAALALEEIPLKKQDPRRGVRRPLTSTWSLLIGSRFDTELSCRCRSTRLCWLNNITSGVQTGLQGQDQQRRGIRKPARPCLWAKPHGRCRHFPGYHLSRQRRCELPVQTATPPMECYLSKLEAPAARIV